MDLLCNKVFRGLDANRLSQFRGAARRDFVSASPCCLPVTGYERVTNLVGQSEDAFSELRVRTEIVEKEGNGTREASALLVRTVGEARTLPPLMVRRSRLVCF